MPMLQLMWALHEDPAFSHRDLAALVAAKVARTPRTQLELGSVMGLRTVLL